MRLLRVLRVWLMAGAVLAVGSTVRAETGATRFYVKSGWFEFHETLNGATFVRDEGWMYGAGVKKRVESAIGLSYEGNLELWGGDLSYDGHDLRNTVPMKTRTTYLGTKEEVAVGVPLGSAATTVEPFAAVGHKFWIRTRSGEDWHNVYLKGGMGADLHYDGWSLFVKGGALLPAYTRNHADLADSGFDDVVTHPKAAVSGFGELGVAVGRISLTLEYEGVRFAKSDEVPITPKGARPGVAVSASHAFQPATSIDWISLRLTYGF